MSGSALSAKFFHDEAAAFVKLESLIWPEGPMCPHCGGLDRITPVKGGRIGLLSAIANRQAVSNSFAMLYDLKGRSEDTESDLIYDESSDIREENRLFLATVGNVLTFAEAKSHFPERLGSAVGSA